MTVDLPADGWDDTPIYTATGNRCSPFPASSRPASIWRLNAPMSPMTARRGQVIVQLKMALDHVALLERKVAELKAMTDTLRHLAANCHGDGRPECPILEDLAQPGRHAPTPSDPAKFGRTGIAPGVQDRR